MAITAPTGEQLRFVSSTTGEHVLDTYLEAAELGGRTLSDLLGDLFETTGANAGNFNASNFEFRFDAPSDKLQVRIGQFSNSTSGWSDITSFFNVTGAFNAATSYSNFDLLTLSNSDVYVVHGLSAGTTFADEATVIASSNTDKIIDVSGAQDWATKTDGQVDSTDYSAKAWSIGGTGVTDTASAGAAKEWATKTSGTVDGTNYSAKYWATHTDVTTVSGAITNVNTVATNIANVNTAATNDANITTVATNIANINTAATDLAGQGSNITTVSQNITDITTVATNITSVNDFNDRYRVVTSDPTTSLHEGDLIYHTIDDQLKVYNGSNWVTGVTAGSGVLTTANNLNDVGNKPTARENLGTTEEALTLALALA